MSGRQVHPIADLFPMLGDSELGDLAADIKERGLLQPIVLDSQGRILDGRNRLRACEIAGIEPMFTTYEGDDPDGYALAVNTQRRHLTQGQIAMIAAKASVICGKSSRAAAEHSGVSQARIAYARTVLQHAPWRAREVAAGALSLDVAYREAQDFKRLNEHVSETWVAIDGMRGREMTPALAEQFTDRMSETFRLLNVTLAWHGRELNIDTLVSAMIKHEPWPACDGSEFLRCFTVLQEAAS